MITSIVVDHLSTKFSSPITQDVLSSSMHWMNAKFPMEVERGSYQRYLAFSPRLEQICRASVCTMGIWQQRCWWRVARNLLSLV